MFSLMTKNIKLNGLMEMTSKIDIAFIITISFLFGFGVGEQGEQGEQGDYKEAKTVFDIVVSLGTGVLAIVAVFSFNSWNGKINIKHHDKQSA